MNNITPKDSICTGGLREYTPPKRVMLQPAVPSFSKNTTTTIPSDIHDNPPGDTFSDIFALRHISQGNKKEKKITKEFFENIEVFIQEDHKIRVNRCINNYPYAQRDLPIIAQMLDDRPAKKCQESLINNAIDKAIDYIQSLDGKDKWMLHFSNLNILLSHTKNTDGINIKSLNQKGIKKEGLLNEALFLCMDKVVSFFLKKVEFTLDELNAVTPIDISKIEDQKKYQGCYNLILVQKLKIKQEPKKSIIIKKI